MMTMAISAAAARVTPATTTPITKKIVRTVEKEAAVVRMITIA